MNQAATPETGTVDAPASMDDIISEIAADAPAPAETAAEEVVEELVEEAEQGQSEEEAEDGDATDADDTGEETVEEEPEGEDEPEPTFKVKVDGEEVEVPLSELQKGYSREQDYTRKTMALAEERRTLEARFANELKQSLELFEQLDPVLQEARQIDWERLKSEDPATFVQYSDAVQQRLDLIGQQRAKIEQVEKAQAEETQKAQEAERVQRLDLAATKIIEAMPELAAEDKFSQFATESIGCLKDYGFTPDEISEALDERTLLLANDARRWRELQKAKQTLPAKKVVPKSQAKALKSGSDGSQAPKTRFPANAPRERQLDYIANQILAEQKG